MFRCCSTAGSILITQAEKVLAVAGIEKLICLVVIENRDKFPRSLGLFYPLHRGAVDFFFVVAYVLAERNRPVDLHPEATRSHRR